MNNYETKKGLSEFSNPGFVGDAVSKPPTAPPPEFIPQDRPPITNLGSISDEEIREACLQFASEHCCYGKKFIRDTVLTDIKNGCAYHYKLETFAETRETSARSVPFTGQFIDGPENGIPPSPWDIAISIQEMFRDWKITAEIPHTAYVKECFKCVGNCRIRCETCRGTGGLHCSRCNGSGRINNVGSTSSGICPNCTGARRIRCHRCIGLGQVKCDQCNGVGKLKHFIMLIVTWKNHISDFVSDTANLPKEQILEVDGRELFKEQQTKLYPIDHCPDPAVNYASTSLITNHQTSFPNELIRMQRQTLRAVPLTKTNYAWKSKTGEFYVFGFQNKVYFENYPQKCFCCVCC